MFKTLSTALIFSSVLLAQVFSIDVERAAISKSDEEQDFVHANRYYFKQSGIRLKRTKPLSIDVFDIIKDREMVFLLGENEIGLSYIDYKILDYLRIVSIDDSQISIDDEKIHLRTSQTFFNTISPREKIDEDGNKLEVDFDLKVHLKNLEMNCERDNRFNYALDIQTSCFNNSRLKAIESQQSRPEEEGIISIDGGFFNFTMKVKEASIDNPEEEGKVDVYGDMLSLDVADFLIQSSQFEMSCFKRDYTTPFDPNFFLADCFKSGDLSSKQMFTVISDKFKLDTEVQIDAIRFFDNSNSLMVKSPAFLSTFKSNQLSGENINFVCAKELMKDKVDWYKLVDTCINQGRFTLDRFTYKSLDGHPANYVSLLEFDESTYDKEAEVYRNKIIRKNPDLTDNQIRKKTSNNLNMKFIDKKIEFNVPLVDISDGINKYSLKWLNLDCDRKAAFSAINAKNILKNCFDSSVLTISSIVVDNPKLQIDVNVDEISIDKEQLKFKVPSAKYVIDKEGKEIKNLNFNCELKADFDSFKNLDYEKIIENCINYADIKIDEIKSGKSFFDYVFGVDAAQDIHLQMGKALCNNERNQGEKDKCLLDASLTNAFSADIAPRKFKLEVGSDLRLLGLPIPLDKLGLSSFGGLVWYQRDSKELVLELTEYPGVTLFFVSTFTKQENMRIVKDKITTDVTKKKKEKRTRIYIKLAGSEKDDQ